MSRRVPYALIQLLLAVLIPLAVYLYLKLQPSLDPVVAEPRGHFFMVSPIALLAAALAISIGIAGNRSRNIQVTFLSMAFTALALVFALHGLSTPGLLLPRTPLPAAAAQFSTLLTAFWLWMSSRPADHPLVARLSRWHTWLVPAWAALLAIMVVTFMSFPGLVGLLPLHTSPLKWGALAVTLGLNLVTAHHYWQSYRYTRFPLQAAIAYSTGWLAGAQIMMTTGELWRVSWWLYHLLLLAATFVMLAGLVRQYATGASIGTAVRGLFAADPIERIEAGISPAFRALVIATETWDRYTAGHSYRVAIYALRLGEAMDLAPEQLRALAQGSIVHDTGKIEVPAHILNKPGSLTPEERAIIERHPVTGYEICRRVGFMQEELEVIRHHHERWDGTGYPDRLRGEQIPILARILAVADVYDALTSSRSYRKAWSHQETMNLIRQQAGQQFDPACVQAWLQINTIPPLLQRYPSWVLTEAAAGFLEGEPSE